MTRARFLLRFAQSSPGQKLIYTLRTNFPDLWAGSKEFRRQIFSVLTPQEPIKSNSFSRIDSPSIGWHSPKPSSVSPIGIGVTIYSPDLVKGEHTISQLALFQAQNLRRKLPTISYLDWQSLDSKYLMSFDKKTINKNYDKSISYGISVFHLGNNYHSVGTLLRFFQSHPSRNVVILHDLFLIDLFQEYYKYTGQPNLFQEKIISTLGIQGIITTSNLKTGKSVEGIRKSELAQVFLEEIKRHARVVISHSDEDLFLKTKNQSESFSYHNIPLPASYTETKRVIEELDYVTRPLILISGHRAYSKNFYNILRALIVVKQEIPNLQIESAGSVSEQIRDEIRAKVEFRTLGVKSNFEVLSDDQWRKFHRVNSIGIRLGVGTNGESSGLVRDYLSLGMKVVSDENTKHLLSNPNYYSVAKGADYLEISESILKALAQPLQQDVDLESSRAEYFENLLEILGAIE
jgi:hypothetical protein